MSPFKLHVPILTARLNVLLNHFSGHTHPKYLQFFVQRLTSVFSKKKCTMQIYTHIKCICYSFLLKILIRYCYYKDTNNYPPTSSTFSSPPSLSCFQGLRPRDPFWFQHNKPQDSVTYALCSFFFCCWFILHNSLRQSRSVHST